MTAETLAGFAGVVLSLIFSYIPGTDSAWAQASGQTKRLVMVVLLALVAGASFGLACAGLGKDFNLALVCDKAGLIELLKVFGVAIMANQSAYALSPQK